MEHRLPEAAAEFGAATQRHPDSIAAPTMVAMILTEQNKKDQAVKQYERVMDVDPNAAVAANNLAWLYMERGEHLDLALQLARRAHAALPTNAEIADTLGWLSYKNDLPDRAVESLQQSVAGDANNPVRHFRLGMSYLLARDKVHARQSLERALKLQADFPGAGEARKALATMQ